MSTNQKIYVVCEDLDDGYNSVAAFKTYEQAAKFAIKNSYEGYHLVIDKVDLYN